MFPCVEIDTSTYAIPTPQTAQTWIRATPKGFTFHAKAFGAFCAQAIPCGSLPREVRDLESMRAVVARLGTPNERVVLAALPNDAVTAIWARFHSFLDPFRLANRWWQLVPTMIFPTECPPRL